MGMGWARQVAICSTLVPRLRVSLVFLLNIEVLVIKSYKSHGEAHVLYLIAMTSPDNAGIARIMLGSSKTRIDDPRFKRSGLKKCIQCGRCTASCPAAYVYGDFRSRDIMRRLLLGELRSDEMGRLIWECGQCYSCRARCPRNCSAGACIAALRAEDVKKGRAPEDILVISETLKHNLYSKGETFLPALLEAGSSEQLIEKRKRLGYPADDARCVPMNGAAVEEVRKIMRLTGYIEEKK
jgi:heterodisulfide reductase subunit C1